MVIDGDDCLIRFMMMIDDCDDWWWLASESITWLMMDGWSWMMDEWSWMMTHDG